MYSHRAPIRPTRAERVTMTRLVELVMARLVLSDQVAAAKFTAHTPIDDPVRERTVIDQVRRRSLETGLNPDTTVRFFRRQIAASKTLQRGLHARWAASHERFPPDPVAPLAEIRPAVDQISRHLVDQLLAVTSAHIDLRRGHARAALATLAARVAHCRALDQLHRHALHVALRAALPRAIPRGRPVRIRGE